VTLRRLYITNVVKVAWPDSAAPSAAAVRHLTPLLLRELEIVQPRRVIAFGTLPFHALTRQRLKMRDAYAAVTEMGSLPTFRVFGDCHLNAPVYPCYFPIGHGQQRRALEMLRAIVADSSTAA
jgi:uracil-DNA glycosylase